VLTLGFKNAGARESFAGGGSDEILRQALIDMVGADWKVEAIIDPSAQPGATPPPRVTKPAVEPQPAPPTPTPAAGPATPDGPPDWAAPGESPQSRADASEKVADERAHRASRSAMARAREGITPTRSGTEPGPVAPQDDPDADADRDDADADESGLQGAELLQRELGATVIEEIPHE
jgi:DNA polymerase-3 subunit gamma/tau